MQENYEKIRKKIASLSNLEEEEIEKRVEAKREKLSGLISKEGAAQIIAAELGISFENEKLKIDELLPGMRKVNLTGKIINLLPVRTFVTKKGDEGKVVNLLVADETSNIKVVLWDTNHIKLIENEKIVLGSVIEILNATMRDNELHLGNFSELNLSDEVLENVKTEKIVKSKKISDFRIGESVVARSFIVQTFPPRFFEVNKETGKKITDEEKLAGVDSEKRALINLVLDDGTETIRAVLFHENLIKIGLDLDNPENMEFQRNDLTGKEFIFSGTIKTNNFFDCLELIVNNVQEINLDTLLSNLNNQ